MQSVTRRGLLGGALLLPAGMALAQIASPFIGDWAGQVEGIGQARLVITAIKANGEVEGRMEFALNSFKAEFADKSSPGPQPKNRGSVSGPRLTIDSAYGGTYELTLNGSKLAGTYTRGTTFHGKAEFTRQ